MVVVDNVCKMIGKMIDILVILVLQIIVGKMIFGKWDERAQATRPEPRPTAPASTPAATVSNGDPKKPQPIMAERPAE